MNRKKALLLIVAFELMLMAMLVVLCGDDNAQPVVNTGTLNH